MLPSSGRAPIAVVTGANGFLGSWVSRRALEHGLIVRACVRDATSTRHAWLASIASRGSARLHADQQQLTLHSADLEQRGSYDAAMAGATIVFHVAASLHRGGGAWSTADAEHAEQQQRVLHAAMRSATLNIIESVRRSPSVLCVVFTSSIATMMDLEPGAYRPYHSPTDTAQKYSQKYGSDDGTRAAAAAPAARFVIDEGRRPNRTRLTEPHHHAWYSLGKLDSEALLTAAAEESGGRWAVVHAAPSDILGPILHRSHAEGSWPARVASAIKGETVRAAVANRPWIVVDVRDVAEAQVRLALIAVAQQQRQPLQSLQHLQQSHLPPWWRGPMMAAAAVPATAGVGVPAVIASGSRFLLSAHPDCYTDGAEVARTVAAFVASETAHSDQALPPPPRQRPAAVQHAHAPEWDGLVADNGKAVKLMGSIFRPLNETLRATVHSLLQLAGGELAGGAGGQTVRDGEMGAVMTAAASSSEPDASGRRPRAATAAAIVGSSNSAQWHALLRDGRSDPALAALSTPPHALSFERAEGSMASSSAAAASATMGATSVEFTDARRPPGGGKEEGRGGHGSRGAYAAKALAVAGALAMPLALALARLLRFRRRNFPPAAWVVAWCDAWVAAWHGLGGRRADAAATPMRPLRPQNAWGGDGSGGSGGGGSVGSSDGGGGGGGGGIGGGGALEPVLHEDEPWRLQSVGMLVGAFLGLNTCLSLLNRWALGDAPGLAGLRIPITTASVHMCVSAALLTPSMASDRPRGYTDAAHAASLTRHGKALVLTAGLNGFQLAANLASLRSLGLASNQAIRALGPVLMALSGWLFAGRAPPPYELLLLTSVTAGVVLVASGGDGAVDHRPRRGRRSTSSSAGVALALLSTVAQCAQVTASSRLMRGRARLDCWQLTLYTAGIGSWLLLPCAWLLEADALANALHTQPHTTLGYLLGSALLALLYNNVLFMSVHVLSATGTVVLGQVKTVVLVLLAATLLGELGDLSANQAAGASLACGAAGAYSYTRARQKDKAEL